MHRDTDESAPQAAAAGEGAGPDPKGSTAGPAPSEFVAASYALLHASADQHMAEARTHRAHAAAHQLNPYLGDRDRVELVTNALHRADTSDTQALDALLRAREVIGQLPPPSLATSPEATEPLAVVDTTVRRDHITQVATLHLGSVVTVSRRFARIAAGTWQTRDPEFIESEQLLGAELAEYADHLGLPSRVANMLPRRPADTATAAARAAEEVRLG